MKHKFQSGKPDGGDSSLVKPSNWNEVHVAGTTDITANTTLDVSHDSVYVTTGASDVIVTLPTSPADGQRYEIKKVDSGAGQVHITGGTMDGSTDYYLVNQYQFITLEFHNAVWHIKAAN